ncbi:HamA C-terminal domain-containing protein [Pedobacter miscanthi]|uniref:DUF1837 domain-containing protein n=1 Tax=Pedobacter miscanthi TaxID=2259170 RepID=A0A366KZ42_9SPHI|nr:DUF1837 domain-containing protein [Pedobacter miscanthi]RBQ06790.1 DUF1837 domain-containing protein [Pedobacter miscanthi]
MSSTLDKFDIAFHGTLGSFCPEIDVSLVDGREVLSILNDYSDEVWQKQKFLNFIWNNIALTALSKNERDKLVDGSYSALIAAAKKLRLLDRTNGDQDTEGSELAEIILYGIMHHHYGALPVVPKIFNKQNAQDNAKGADSIHLVADKHGDFTIWHGEAKFYNSIEDNRLPKIIESVLTSLEKSAIVNENRIISSSSDLKSYLKDNTDLYEKVIRILDDEASIDPIKARLNVPILFLHECKITGSFKEMCEEYIQQVLDYQRKRASQFHKKIHSKASKDDGKNIPVINFEKIKLHFIFFPVPDKKSIISEFLNEVEHFKSKG